MCSEEREVEEGKEMMACFYERENQLFPRQDVEQGREGKELEAGS